MKQLIILALILLVGCQSIWDRRIGVYTYQNALGEYGPPDKSDMLRNKCTVARWELPEKTLILIFGRSDILVSYKTKKKSGPLNGPLPPKPEPEPLPSPKPKPDGKKKVKNHWPNGNRQSVWYIMDGKLDGPLTSWRPNGETLWLEGIYRKGVEHGLFSRWYPNGYIRDKRTFDDGKLLSGEVWKPNGEKCPKTRVDKDGNGVMIIYDAEDGDEINQQIFKNGKPLPGKRVPLIDGEEPMYRMIERYKLERKN